MTHCRRFRWQFNRNRSSTQGHTAVGFGLRLGYWPCLHAPYLQIAFAFWRIDLWHGLPSYRNPD